MWRLEDLGEVGDILLDIQTRWETLRAEAERLVSSHHWTGEAALWTRGEKELEDSGRWQQLVVAGTGFPAPPTSVCEAAPVLCSLPAQLYQAVFSTLIGRYPTRLGSHWSRASECCLRQQSYAMKNQFVASRVCFHARSS